MSRSLDLKQTGFCSLLTILTLLFTACSEHDEPRAGSEGTGSTAGSSSTGGSGARFQARTCGESLPCNQGATCSRFDIENFFTCECDPSNHYTCNAYGMSTIPTQGCTQSIACQPLGQGPGDPCKHDNGYCVSTCTCKGGCTWDCSGSGPATQPTGVTCDEHYCDAMSDVGTGCWIKDGACDYSVSCGGGGKVDGQCPPSP